MFPHLYWGFLEMRRNWKSVYPTSLLEALRLAKDFAREKRNFSVERIADLMGVSHDVLYKWLATGRMPANMIPPYEHACGCTFVSRWLSTSTGKLVIDIPAGKAATTQDMHALQAVLHDAVGKLLGFYDGSAASAEDVLAVVQRGLEGLAWHRQNVIQHESPQLDFGAPQ
ncbi:hypothetical protein [Bordetella bronchiseptica]|uniref:hypothetical protein n=1 Tax=Bordetella bronchiseptica TaxID=518 RepID=UPI001E2F1F5F|nr:hypothetical protein [Bordetella bronchiseptica]